MIEALSRALRSLRLPCSLVPPAAKGGTDILLIGLGGFFGDLMDPSGCGAERWENQAFAIKRAEAGMQVPLWLAMLLYRKQDRDEDIIKKAKLTQLGPA